jgi:hypothetical protein
VLEIGLRLFARVAGIVAFAAGLAVCTPVPASAAVSWSIRTSPNQGANSNFLYDVSCASANACAAVGFYTAPGADKALVEWWNGSSWKVVPSPSPGAVWNFLYDVDCRTATSCTAVGRYENDSGVNRTLIEVWNGTSWKVVPSPNNGTGPNVLSGVACPTSTFCVAVGDLQKGGIDRTLIEMWNGSVWKAASTPNHSKLGNSLSAVSCTSASSCTAVGASVDVDHFSRTLVESWDGSSWKLVASPNNGTSGNALTGVACPSASACYAVGTLGAGKDGQGGKPATLAESWDGHVWKLVSTPNRSAYANALARVSCAAVGSCKAVGWSQDKSGGSRRTLVESWNGTAWTAMSSPNPVSGAKADAYLHARGAALNGVSCVTPTACTAVGFHVDGNGFDRSLVERYR